MKCLRCGYCCLKLFSIVIDNPEKGISDDNFVTNLDTHCKHLVGDKPGEYSCAIHDYPWYPQTPCADYQSQMFYENQDCRMGAFLLKEEKNKK